MHAWCIFLPPRRCSPPHSFARKQRHAKSASPARVKRHNRSIPIRPLKERGNPAPCGFVGRVMFSPDYVHTVGGDSARQSNHRRLAFLPGVLILIITSRCPPQAAEPILILHCANDVGVWHAGVRARGLPHAAPLQPLRGVPPHRFPHTARELLEVPPPHQAVLHTRVSVVPYSRKNKGGLQNGQDKWEPIQQRFGALFLVSPPGVC